MKEGACLSAAALRRADWLTLRFRVAAAVLGVTLALLVLGCERGGESSRQARSTAGAADAPVVLFVGTSLTAGYGLDPAQAYPALVQREIAAAGLSHRVVNAGVNGETSAGALQRLDWLVRQPFDVVVLEVGANDMLQRADPASTCANLQALIDGVRSKRPDARIVLVGLNAPPELGLYGRRFAAIYPELARRNRVPLVAALLDGVAGDAALNLPDGIHPNAAGQARLARNVWEVLNEVL